MSLPPGEVHTEEFYRPAHDLLDPKDLPEEYDPRGDPRDGDQVLVDKHPVGPLLTKGVHPKIVSETLGHSSVSITLDVYSHVIPGLGDAAALAIEDVLGA